MKKQIKRASPLILGAVACLIIWWIVDSSQSFQTCIRESEIGAANDPLQQTVSVFVREFSVYRRCLDAYVIAKNVAITALGTAIIAVFTTVLGIFTMSLAKSTRIAANAAELAARAAIRVDLPHVYIDNLEFQESGVANLAANLQFPRIAISVKNYGRTPAFLGQLAAEMLIAPALPERPDYSNTARDLPSGTVIVGETSYELPTARLHNIPIETIEDIIAERTYLWIYGYLSYRDYLRDPHCLRFCAQLIVLNGDGHTGSVHIIESGEGTKYTESY